MFFTLWRMWFYAENSKCKKNDFSWVFTERSQTVFTMSSKVYISILHLLFVYGSHSWSKSFHGPLASLSSPIQFSISFFYIFKDEHLYSFQHNSITLLALWIVYLRWRFQSWNNTILYKNGWFTQGEIIIIDFSENTLMFGVVFFQYFLK